MPSKLVDKSVSQLLEAFASSAPTPGGGSASALAGAVGASLLLMVASLPKTRHGSVEDRSALTDAREALSPAARELAGLVDRDAEAYDRVVAAYRLPKGTDPKRRRDWTRSSEGCGAPSTRRSRCSARFIRPRAPRSP